MGRKVVCCRSLILIEFVFRKSYTFFQFNIAVTQRDIHSVAMVFHLHYGLVSQLPNAKMITPIQLKNILTSHLQKQSEHCTESKVDKGLPYNLQLQNMPSALQSNLLPLFYFSVSKAPSVSTKKSQNLLTFSCCRALAMIGWLDVCSWCRDMSPSIDCWKAFL